MSGDSISVESRVRWYRRMAIRLALLFALVAVGVRYLIVLPAHDLHRLLGIPVHYHTEGQVEMVGGDEDDEELEDDEEDEYSYDDGTGHAPCSYVDVDVEPVILSGDEFERVDRRHFWLDVVLTITPFALTAVALFLLLSLLVSRRVVRLSAAAAQPLGEGDLGAHLDDSGDDEIAVLARSMNDVRREVAARVRDMSSRDRQSREWIAQVSHDLRTPLTALLACLSRASLIVDEIKDEATAAKMRELLAVAQLDADRVQMLAEDLLEIARLEAGDDLLVEPVPPGELVRQTVVELRPLAASRGLEIVSTIDTDLPILSADGRRLMRALENLLRNAAQHARHFVEVRTYCQEHEVRFEVRDDGPGLPELAGRVDLTQISGRRRSDSAGLGLVVAQKVAEAHSGSFGAENSTDGGAVVWFGVPLPADEAGDVELP